MMPVIQATVSERTKTAFDLLVAQWASALGHTMTVPQFFEFFSQDRRFAPKARD